VVAKPDVAAQPGVQPFGTVPPDDVALPGLATEAEIPGGPEVGVGSGASPGAQAPVVEPPGPSSVTELPAAPYAVAGPLHGPATVAAEPMAVDPVPVYFPPIERVHGSGEKESLRGLCRGPDVEGFIEESRQTLQETFCGATLWFDGLFGGEASVQNAQAVSGRVELSTLYTDYEGTDYHGRLRLNYDLPNLERRLRLFLGRDDDEEFVADRQEGFAIRSSVFGLEDDDEWLAGLGYNLPGKYLARTDFRVGGRVSSEPEIFVQWRYRRNDFVGSYTVWRSRATLFWENREDGFGTTASVDIDRVLRRDLLLRLANVGTIHEATEGVEWRSATVLYVNLRGTRAISGELFIRGETDAEVQLREYGTRVIYREPLGRPYLFGEIIVGYTWPREELHEPREGSGMIGFGLELLFGNDPW
jgi:hypothetical protein